MGYLDDEFHTDDEPLDGRCFAGWSLTAAETPTWGGLGALLEVFDEPRPLTARVTPPIPIRSGAKTAGNG